MTNNQTQSDQLRLSGSEMSHREKTIKTSLISCYLALNVYGKTPEDLPAIYKVFDLVLEGVQPDIIQLAFVQWLRDSSDMPTPSDIYKLCKIISGKMSSIAKQEDNLKLFMGG